MIEPTLPEPIVAALGRLSAEGEKYFGHPDVAIEPLAWTNREAAQVLRAQTRIDGRCGRNIFVKAFKPRGPSADDRRFMRARVVKDFAVSSRVHESLRSSADLGAVRPIACFADDLVLVTEEAAGTPFYDVLERLAVWHPNDRTLDTLVSVAGRIGAWLARFQRIEPLGRRVSMDEMREYLDFRLRRLTAKGAFSEEQRNSVLSYFDARSRDVVSDDLVEVSVHGDLCPSNVLVDGPRVVMIDFAMACTGGRYFDVARLFTQFEFLTFKPKFRPHVVARLQAALLNGFDPSLRADHPLFQLFELQHVICHIANLSLNPAPPVARLYNLYQLHRHHRWLRERAA
jgi:hypothetical protein